MATDYTGAIGALLKRKHYDARNKVRRERYRTDAEYRERHLHAKRERYREARRARP